MNRILGLAVLLTAAGVLGAPIPAEAGLKPHDPRLEVLDNTGRGLDYLVIVDPTGDTFPCESLFWYQTQYPAQASPVPAGNPLYRYVSEGKRRVLVLFFDRDGRPTYYHKTTINAQRLQTSRIVLTPSNTGPTNCPSSTPKGDARWDSRDGAGGQWVGRPPPGAREVGLAALATALLGGLGAVGFVLARRKE